MPTFKVCLYDSGKSDGIAPREIVADTAKHAAVAAAGEPLIEAGTFGNFRAKVWEANRIPLKQFYFYRDVRRKKSESSPISRKRFDMKFGKKPGV